MLGPGWSVLSGFYCTLPGLPPLSRPVDFAVTSVTKSTVTVVFKAAPGDRPDGYVLRHEVRRGGEGAAVGYHAMNHTGGPTQIQTYVFTKLGAL